MKIDRNNALCAINSELIKNGSEFMYSETNPQATCRVGMFVKVQHSNLNIPLETYLKFIARSSLAFLVAVAEEQGRPVSIEDVMNEMSGSDASGLKKLASEIELANDEGEQTYDCHVCLEVYQNYPVRLFIGVPDLDPKTRVDLFFNKEKAEPSAVVPSKQKPEEILGMRLPM